MLNEMNAKSKKKVLEDLIASMEDREASSIPALQITIGGPGMSDDMLMEGEDMEDEMDSEGMPEGFAEMIKRKKKEKKM